MTDPQPDMTLLQLTRLIEEELERNLDRFYWIVAEISELRVDQRGHCYITFVEKDETTQNIAARMSAHCWNFKYAQLQLGFRAATGQQLATGMKILCCVEVEMHSIYSIALNIVDIDANYTLGELSRQRKATIERLKSDGVFDLNKQLPLSKIPNRIAVISSEKAAGYGDFMHQLHDNGYSFRFQTTLYPAIVQGEQAPQSIMHSLELINEQTELYDCVVIIRGGGATSDMNCFDDYQLASYCANFPLPVITGIGHDRDLSVTDMVAYKSLKTPTAVAEWIVARVADQYQILSEFSLQLKQITQIAIDRERQALRLYEAQLAHSVSLNIQKQKYDVEKMSQQIFFHLQQYLINLRQSLQMFEKEISLSDTENIYKRGFSLLTKHDRVIMSSSDITSGDIIKATLPDQSETILQVV